MVKKDYIRAAILDSITFSFIILAVGFWIFQPSQEALLRLDRNFLFFITSFFIGVLTSIFIYKKRVDTMGTVLFKTKKIGEEVSQKNFFLKFSNIQMIVVFTIALIAGVQITKFNAFELLSPDGFGGAKRVFISIFNPNFSILPEAVLKIIETIFMAFMATALAVPIAFVLSFLAAKNIMSDHIVSMFIYSTLRIFLNITRSIEALIWAIVFSIWVGIGPFAGMLALWLHSVVSLAKNYSELAEGISEGPIEAIKATGANAIQTVWFAVVPQVILPYTAFTIYRWDINIRMATVIGLVGGGGIGTLLNLYQGQALWREVGCLIIVIAVAVWLMDMASAYIREALK